MSADAWVLGANDDRCDVRNISVGGLAFECLDPREVEKSMRIALDVEGQRIAVEARVVHATRVGRFPNRRYLMGLEFGPLSVRELRAIRNYVASDAEGDDSV